MKRRLKLILLILVATPLFIQLWLLQYLVKSNTAELSNEYQTIRREKLRAFSERFEQVISRIQVDLINNADDSRYVKNSFFVSYEGQLLNSEFYNDTLELWKNNRFLNEVVNRDSEETQSKKEVFGWLRFFDGSNYKLYFWQDNLNSYKVCSINYAAVLADLIAVLPDGNGIDESFCFEDLRGNKLYCWGKQFPENSDLQSVVFDFNVEPFSSFKLKLFLDKKTLPENRLAGSFQNNLIYISVILIGAFVTLAVYFYRSSKREFSEAQKKVSFVNRVSHELKTPLSNICLYSELMAAKLGEEAKVSHHLQVINSEANRLSRLIHNILTFSNQRRGVSKLRIQKLTIPDFFADYLEVLTFPLSQKGFEVKIDCCHEKSLRFDGDLVKQVLGNLISNVEKYATDGKFISVTISVKNDFLVLNVEDRGEGIDEADKLKIFSPFYRSNNKLNAGVSGSGIGLTISRELCQLHGGTLTFEDLEKGCRFTATFRMEK